MRIGVFDSGIGGLNVLSEMLKKYPNNEYIYYGDTKNVPYGDKSVQELITLSLKIVRFFEEKKVDLIIIACGTISSNCYKELKRKTNIPIYDIITPTINYLNKSTYHTIGLIGTSRTIDSHVFEKKIINHHVFSKATKEFVYIIENGEINQKIDIICDSLKEFKNNIDCLVLGCTHYPLLKTEINEYLNIPLIDMGKCLMQELNLTNNSQKKITLYFSLLNNKTFSNINNIILDEKEIIEYGV